MKSTLKLYLLMAILLLCLNAVSFAQQTDSQTTNREAEKSLVIGKAVYLAKPVYPREAYVNRISGQVSVKIRIDENGNVIAATAQTGDVLLHKAAEEAALKSKFTPTTLNGTPIKVTASISFNFTLFDDWEAVGYALSTIESGKGSKAYGQRAADFTWQGFDEERTEFDELRANETTEGKAERAKKLIRKIEEKLAIWNPTERWYFKLGILSSNLDESAEKTGEVANFQKYLKELEQLVKAAPKDIPRKEWMF